MVDFIASIELPTLTDHLSLYGFAALALVLLALVALDMRRIVKATAKTSAPTQFLSPYQRNNEISVFYDAGEDPSARAAHRVIAMKRRDNDSR